MSWHAVDELASALDATKRLLFPFTWRRWVVLGVIVFFVSGVSGFNPSVSLSVPDFEFVVGPGEPTVPGWEEPIWWEEPVFDDPWNEEVWTAAASEAGGSTTFLALLLLFGLTAAIGIAVAYVASVLELVFVEVARTREVRIRGFFGQHARSGASLFLFRIAILLAVLAPLIAVVILTAVSGGLFLFAVVLASPLLIVGVIAVWLLVLFTDEFVVPIMVVEDLGVLSGWRRFWPQLRIEAKQYGMFAVIRALLGVAAGILSGVGFAVVTVVIALPVFLIGIVGVALLGGVLGSGFLGIMWIVGLLVIFVAGVVIVGTMAIQTPIHAYLRYYSLFVLGSITPMYDLVTDIRAEIDAKGSVSDDEGEIPPGTEEPAVTEGTAGGDDGEDRVEDPNTTDEDDPDR